MANALKPDFLQHGPLDPRDILTPKELAQRLKVSRSWVFESYVRACESAVEAELLFEKLRG